MRSTRLPLALLGLVLAVRAQIGPQIVMDDPSGTPPAAVPLVRPQPLLADLLTVDASVSIFYTYARELPLSARLADPTAHTTVLAPKNRAVIALPRKPHQSPESVDGDITVTEEQFERVSKQNVERWVSAHLLPSTFPLGEGFFATMLAGKNVTFTKTHARLASPPEWTEYFLEQDVKIVDRKEASNGVLYVVDGTIKPE